MPDCSAVRMRNLTKNTIMDIREGLALGLLIWTLTVLVSGCRSVKYVPAYVEDGDSTHTETSRSVVTVKDTIWTVIPEQRAERETRDTTSHLENDYAESRAWLTADGTLHHTLATKPQDVPHEFDRPVERRDSTVYRYRTRTVNKPYPVEKEPDMWERLRLDTWWLLALGVFIMLTRRNRK